MTRIVTSILALALGAGCATTSTLERRVAELERELAQSRAGRTTVTRPVSPNEAVALGNAAAAATPSALIGFVDEKPPHCAGALCWEIVNQHANPVLLTVDGQPVQIVGPYGPLVPPRSTAYIRLTAPGRRHLTYELYDQVRLADSGPTMPLPTVLARCSAQDDVGSWVDAHWGGHTSYLRDYLCM